MTGNVQWDFARQCERAIICHSVGITTKGRFHALLLRSEWIIRLPSHRRLLNSDVSSEMGHNH